MKIFIRNFLYIIILFIYYQRNVYVIGILLGIHDFFILNTYIQIKV